MISIKNQILLFAFIGCLAFVVADKAGRPSVIPDRPSILGGRATMLVTYDVDKKPELVHDPKFLEALEAACVADGYRVVPDGTEFNDDLPQFKALTAEPAKSPNWIRVAHGKKFDTGAELPAELDAAIQFVEKHKR